MKKKQDSSNATWFCLAGGIILAIVVAILGFSRSNDAYRAEAAPGSAVHEEVRAPTPTATPAAGTESLKDGVAFNDFPAQMREFMGYDDSIHLTADQQAIKEKALGSHPAVCCHDSSALTCCCPCNLSRSVWGLTNYLIARKGYDAAQVENAVADWMAFTNPSGYTGDACYVPGGCERSPRQNGCGGMDANDLVL